MDDELLKIEIEKIEELLILKKLNLVYMDVTRTLLTWVFDYCENKGIPIWKEKSLLTLIRIAENTLKEMCETSAHLQELNKSLKLPLKKRNDENPDELPVP